VISLPKFASNEIYIYFIFSMCKNDYIADI